MINRNGRILIGVLWGFFSAFLLYHTRIEGGELVKIYKKNLGHQEKEGKIDVF